MPTPSRKTLPIGIQTLAEIRRDGHYYVDKTGFAQRLIERGKYYFLSRPRRFGKSLFLDTLKELFEGNQTLFAGLQIHAHWDWTQCYPVIRFSFGGGVLEDKADLRRFMAQQLEKYERQHDLPARYPDNRGRFQDLLERLHQKSGQRVVVLVDEYDKPILDRIEDLATAQSMREELKNIYSIIKDQDAHIRFAFLTGVSKFTKVSLFSGLNNLKDITLDPHYSALCGYTEQDLDNVFAPELEGFDRTEMRRWYNGYNWTGTSVYNPFDLLLLFDNRRFDNWWFETGTPGFLVKLLAERGFFTPRLAQMRTSGELIGGFDIERITPEALLFQAGYLTIHKTAQTAAGNWRYTLGYPNREVEVGLNTSLLSEFSANNGQSEQYRQNLEDLLIDADLPGIEALLHAFFASIPYHWYANNPIAQYEGYYASVFYSYFAALGFEVRVEEATNHGRIDMAVILPAHIYLFEFKVVELLPEGRALQQIKDKAYADKYREHALPISLVGVEFSRQTRNLVAFETELIPD